MKVIFHNVQIPLIAGVSYSLYLPHSIPCQKLILNLSYYPASLHAIQVMIEVGDGTTFISSCFPLDLHGQKILPLADMENFKGKDFNVSLLRFTSDKDCILFVNATEITVTENT